MQDISNVQLNGIQNTKYRWSRKKRRQEIKISLEHMFVATKPSVYDVLRSKKENVSDACL
jgi:hypothetical protein